MAAGPDFLTEGMGHSNLVRLFNEMKMELFTLRVTMTQINTKQQQRQQHNQNNQGKDAELTRWRTLQMLGKSNGDEKVFKDFDFKFNQFVRQVPGFEKFLDWVRLCDVEPIHESMEHYKAQTGVALEYLNDQLYGVLPMVTEGMSLRTTTSAGQWRGIG